MTSSFQECLALIEGRPHGLVCLLNDQCNFGGSTDQQLLQKFKDFHGQGRNGQSNGFYDEPQKKENAFFVKHYAGKVCVTLIVHLFCSFHPLLRVYHMMMNVRNANRKQSFNRLTTK